MANSAKKIQIIDINLETKPGALARVYRGFQESNISVTASWGYEMGPNQANAHFYVQEPKKALDVLTKMGLKPKTSWAVWCEGKDKAGAYADALTKIEKAGVNVHATDAFALEGQLGSVFFVDEKDLPATCKALGCK